MWIRCVCALREQEGELLCHLEMPGSDTGDAGGLNQAHVFGISGSRVGRVHRESTYTH